MYIAIAGNIGSGKTSLTGILAERTGARAYYEDSDNPYIGDFYEDMNRWSFNLQIYFLGQRIREAAEKALSIDPKKLMFPMPDHFRVEIAFRNHTYATNGSHYPGCVQLDSTRVAFESNDYMDVLKFFYWVL